MTDVLLEHTENGGDITYVNGQLRMTEGIETSLYLSLFGGNREDSGTPADDSKQWWGNVIEPNESARYRSRTQHALRTLPITTSNLRKLEDAARQDLDWMIVEGVATSIDVAVSMPKRNHIDLDIDIVVDGRALRVSFSERWGTQ